MGQPVAWFEIVSPEAERARKFYTELFGWQAAADPNMGGYAVVDTQGGEGAKRLVGGRVRRVARVHQAHRPTWLPSGSVKMANRPKSPGRSVGGTSRLPPSFSARSR